MKKIFLTHQLCYLYNNKKEVKDNFYLLENIVVLGDLPYFSVYVDLEHRGSKTHVSFVKAVFVEVYGHMIQLTKDGRILVMILVTRVDIKFTFLNLFRCFELFETLHSDSLRNK